MNAKITKRLHAFKSYESSYNVKILNSFNSELQLKDVEFSIKNKLIDLLTELKDFTFVTTLVLEFKKIEQKQNMIPFIRTQKQKQVLIKVTMIMYLNRSILQLYQIYKSLWKRCRLDY